MFEYNIYVVVKLISMFYPILTLTRYDNEAVFMTAEILQDGIFNNDNVRDNDTANLLVIHRNQK